MAATWLQAWRLGSLRTRLSKYLADRYSVVLYKMSENVLGEQGIYEVLFNNKYIKRRLYF